MKLNKILLVFLAAGFLFSCQNDDATFPDFDYTTVYFANQFPLRTLVLGDDPQVDLTLDNEHKVKITSTIGGAYSNTKDRTISIRVDESLCNGVKFKGGSNVVALPAEYYKLESNQIVIKAGSILGGVVVELTNAFFEDPLSIGRNYVIPIVMTDVTNADSILSGRAIVENPNRVVSSDWAILPKDYMLYGIKYVNPWHANYLRRGEDQISNGTTTKSDVRRDAYIEYDELVKVSTVSYKGCSLPITIYEDDNLTTRANIQLLLTFDDNNNCTISSNSTSYTVTGTGRFVTDGAKKSMSGLDRDALYLDYTVALPNFGYTYSTKDTLVARDRGIAPEYYTIVTN